MIGKAILAAMLIAVGVLLFAVSILAIFDPVGAKAADDADPFGEPPSRLSSIGMALGSAALVAAGIWVIVRAVKASRPSANSR